MKTISANRMKHLIECLTKAYDELDRNVLPLICKHNVPAELTSGAARGHISFVRETLMALAIDDIQVKETVDG
jgi:hypothetical protein